MRCLRDEEEAGDDQVSEVRLAGLSLWDPCDQCGLPDGDAHWARAAGNAVCDQCGKDFNRHPMDTVHLGYDGHPWLNKLCDGRLVKT